MKKSTQQLRWMGLSVLAGIIGMLAANAANATTAAIADYQLGEADPGATAGAIGDNPTIDSSSSGFDLARTGSLVTPSPSYSSNAAPGTGSTLSMAFVSADSDIYSRPAVVTSATKDVRIDAWAYPTTTTSSGYVVLNGSGADGYGILQLGNTWSFIEEFVNVNYASGPLGTVVPNQWVHLSLLLDDNGDLTGYINGTAVVTQTAPAHTPTSQFFIGSGFDGEIDEVEVFIPEPASASILLVSGLALMGVRRRR